MGDRSQSSREVLAWQKAHVFTLAIWRVTASFPREELSVITAQLRRAAMSIPSNFAEGYRKRPKPDRLRFHNIAQGSADQALHQLILAHDLGHADTTALQADLKEVCRPLQGCINGLELNGS